METRSEGNADRGAAILRELQALQQELTHLNVVEQPLLSELPQVHQQINEASWQVSQAQQANQPDQYNRAMYQRSTSLAAAANLQEQLGRIAARKQEIARRQQDLQAQLNTVQSPQLQADFRLRAQPELAATEPAPAGPSPTPHRSVRGRLIWLAGLAVLALVVILASFGLVWRLKPSSTAGTPPQRITLSSDNQPFFQPVGDLPSEQYCLDHLGTPCLSPEAIQQAFRLNPLYRSGYDGKGQTMVLLGTGHTTTLQADVQHFDQTWGLPDPALTILQPDGAPAPYTCPGDIDQLEGENTLDVEWAHAIAPGAKIVLVIGSNAVGASPQDNCTEDITVLKDVDYVVTHHLGQVLSMSFGLSELGNVADTANDKANLRHYIQLGETLFRQAASQRITVLAATGDAGATNLDGASGSDAYWSTPNVSWPASDPDVLAVGGSTLSLDAANDYQSEAVWNDVTVGATGGGLSTVFSEPDYQKKLSTHSLFQGHRGLPDVAFPADGFLVYDSVSGPGLGQVNPQWDHWEVAHGTSLSAPSFAGVMALANQVRGQPLGLIQPALYALQGQGMHDITSGTNSFDGVSGYQAQPGYDLASGWGTPIADQFIPDLVQAAEQSA